MSQNGEPICIGDLTQLQRLDLARGKSAEAGPVAVLRFQRNKTGCENEMPAVISCNDLPDGDYQVYAAPQPQTAAMPDEWRSMVERLTSTVEDLNDTVRNQIDDDLEDPELEAALCDETDELVQEARALLATVPEVL